nr:ribosomal protein S18-alanine N-acetyltransferase [Desulfobulbus alkaliphilus]
MGGVLAIEQSAMAHPWSAAQVKEELALANSTGLTALLDGRLLGYAMFRACRPECELIRLVVDEQWQRRGIGRTLLDTGLQILVEQGYTTCFLEVRAANEAAIHLYRAAGFFQVGLRKKYYTQPSEDALLFRADLVNPLGEKS